MPTLQRNAGLLLLLLMIGSACGNGPDIDEETPQYEDAAVDTTRAPEDRLEALFSDYDAAFVTPQRIDTQAARQWVDQTLASLSLEEKIGQLLIVDLSDGGIRGLFSDPGDLVRELHVGGFLVPRLMSPSDVFRRTQDLQEISGVPLFFAADYERGVGRFSNALTELPSNMAVGATRDAVFAAAMGRLTAIESRAIGINLVFAPVVDVNNNPDNPIINIRSYGEDPELVGEMASAYVREAQRFGLQTTLKHFPGHGDTEVDTHARMAVVESSRAVLDSVELKPYQMVFAQQVQPAAVMSAHLWLPALDEDPRPATFSERALTGLLREELGFGGFVVTDDIKMGALQHQFGFEERILSPIRAGADVILTPGEPGRAAEVIREAVEEGRLNEARIDTSVRRVLWAKARAGLYDGASAGSERLEYLLDEKRGAAMAQAIADEAITLLRTSSELPLDDSLNTLLVQVTNYRGSESIGAAMDLLERRQREMGPVTAFRFDDDVSSTDVRNISAAAEGADVVIVSLYLRLIAGRGDAGLDPGQHRLVAELVSGSTPTILSTFGNPYAVSSYADADVHVVAYDQSLETVRAFHRLLTGTLKPSGKLPITVDPYPFGWGLESVEPSESE